MVLTWLYNTQAKLLYGWSITYWCIRSNGEVSLLDASILRGESSVFSGGVGFLGGDDAPSATGGDRILRIISASLQRNSPGSVLRNPANKLLDTSFSCNGDISRGDSFGIRREVGDSVWSRGEKSPLSSRCVSGEKELTPPGFVSSCVVSIATLSSAVSATAVACLDGGDFLRFDILQERREKFAWNNVSRKDMGLADMVSL